MMPATEVQLENSVEKIPNVLNFVTIVTKTPWKRYHSASGASVEMRAGSEGESVAQGG
ncbi:MAG: hypothetical protein ACBR23_00170 [Microcoleus sp.]|uniref:hypothetical protein n=1 Tax=Microcoleus sp. TaxID=44472 RepID=UPI0035269F71